MDLSNPLSTVTPTLDAAVLRALASTTAMVTGAEAHRMAGTGSVDGVRKVLLRLVGQGIVEQEVHGRISLYRLNREHLAAGAIVALARLRDALIERLIAELNAWRLPPRHAGIFGSFARGEADAESDIDLLVVSSGLPEEARQAWERQVVDLARAVERWTGNRCQVLNLEEEVLVHMAVERDPLVDSWRADEVHLVGERLADLLRPAGPGTASLRASLR